MSQVNGSAPGTGTAAPASGPGNSAPAQPAAGAGQTGQGGGAPGNLMQVDRNAFEPWGGDYHKAVEDAKYAQSVRQHEQRAGIPIEQLVELWLQAQNPPAGEPPAGGAAQPPQQQVPGEKPLTAAELQKLLDEREKTATERSRQEAEQQQRANAEKSATDAREAAWTEAAKAIGYGPDDKGAAPPQAKWLRPAYEAALDDQVFAAIPNHLKGNADAVRYYLTTTVPTQEMKAASLKAVQDTLADIATRARARAAGSTDNIPAQTLSGGPGGGTTVPTASKDPKERFNQRVKWAQESIDRRMAHR